MNMLDAITEQRAALWRAGFRPLAIHRHDHPDPQRAGKAPIGDNWQTRARRDPPEVIGFPAVAHAPNTGILCDGLRGVDIDIDDAATAAAARALALEMLGEPPVRIRSNSPRCLLPYRAAVGSPSKRVLAGALGKIEVLGHGQQFVAFGMHPSGAPIEWVPDALGDVSRDALPAVTEEQITAFLTAAAPLIGAQPPGAEKPKPSGADGLHATADAEAADILDVVAALAVIPNAAAPDWEHWNKVGMATWAASGGSIHGFNAWCAWSSKNPAHDEDACRARWNHYPTSPPNQTGAGKLYKMAAEAFPGWKRPSESRPSGAADSSEAAADNDWRPPEFTDEALALRFTQRHQHTLRYVAAWGRWLLREPAVWRFDDTLHTFDLARLICRETAAVCNKDSIARGLATAKTVAAVERLAKADRRHAATTDQWDADHWLLNTPDGVVDLRTGRMRAHRSDDYMTKITSAAPASNPDCPLWLKFLNEATRGDADFIRFLQQWCGYSLTGDTSEHALLFVYGSGGNGKGVFISTVGDIIGGYREIAAMDTFTATQSDRHPADLAKLRGARMVVVSEVEEGRAWAEARIKQLTGGDRIAARFMRQDFFEFDPLFKLTITGNHRPVLRNVDEAARRRINMAPFVYEPPKKDTMMREKLKAEWPGILRWMIDGCLDWQANGLARPPVVTAATAEYFSEQDSVQLWIEDCCEISPHIADTGKSLFASWKNYALSRGDDVGTQKWFAGTLQNNLRFQKIRDECGIRGRGFKGVRVREFSGQYGPQQDHR